MSVGGLLYFVILVVAFLGCYRSAKSYSDALVRTTGTGLIGYDAGYSVKFVRAPMTLWREAALTRAWTLTTRAHADRELERLRRPFAAWTVLALLFALFDLALF